ncbi:MAG: hypothetical protein HYY46_00600 [Deltaproteobacteria bacterium]|nr:hypothetical protein [Deltaproteobacteria bacterium]
MDRNKKLYVAIGNGDETRGGVGDVLIFEYDTRSGKKRFLNSVRQILKEAGNLGPNNDWPHEEGVAKVHSEIIEYNGKMYFSTHDYHSSKNVEKHRGGHFISYDPATGKFADLSKSDPGGVAVANEGIIAINILRQEQKLVGWTFPYGHVLLHDLRDGKTTRYGRGLMPGQKSNVARVVIATRKGDVFAAYSQADAPNYLFKLDRKLGKLIPTTARFRKGFFVGLAESSDGNIIYLADVEGYLYVFHVESETLNDLGSILPPERTGQVVRRLGSLAYSGAEQKLFTIPYWVTKGNGAYHLYEYDIKSRARKEIADFSSVLKGSTITGNGVIDEKGFMYFSFYSAAEAGRFHSGVVQIDVSGRTQ